MGTRGRGAQPQLRSWQQSFGELEMAREDREGEWRQLGLLRQFEWEDHPSTGSNVPSGEKPPRQLVYRKSRASKG